MVLSCSRFGGLPTHTGESLVMRTFYGCMSRSMRCCECGRGDEAFEPFRELELPLDFAYEFGSGPARRTLDEVTLHEALDHLQRGEPIDRSMMNGPLCWLASGFFAACL